jgi:hypothetical protein
LSPNHINYIISEGFFGLVVIFSVSEKAFPETALGKEGMAPSSNYDSRAKIARYNELPRRKPAGYQNECFIVSIAASSGELNPTDFASHLK